MPIHNACGLAIYTAVTNKSHRYSVRNNRCILHQKMYSDYSLWWLLQLLTLCWLAFSATMKQRDIEIVISKRCLRTEITQTVRNASYKSFDDKYRKSLNRSSDTFVCSSLPPSIRVKKRCSKQQTLRRYNLEAVEYAETIEPIGNSGEKLQFVPKNALSKCYITRPI